MVHSSVAKAFPLIFNLQQIKNPIMAVGLPTSAKSPVQNRLQVLQAQNPQYHVVLWASDGGFLKLMPGTRWVRKDVELIQLSNLWNLTTGTHHFEYYIIIEGGFQYRNKNMKATK